jgi:hypothetical protein
MRAEAWEVSQSEYMLGGVVTHVEKLQKRYDDAQNELEHLYDSGKLSAAGFRVAMREMEKWHAHELLAAIDLDAQDKEEATA